MSTAKLFKDAREELTVAYKVLGAATLAQLVRPLAAAALAAKLAGAWRERWRKSPAGRARPPRVRAEQSGANQSVHRLVQQSRK